MKNTVLKTTIFITRKFRYLQKFAYNRKEYYRNSTETNTEIIQNSQEKIFFERHSKCLRPTASQASNSDKLFIELNSNWTELPMIAPKSSLTTNSEPFSPAF